MDTYIVKPLHETMDAVHNAGGTSTPYSLTPDLSAYDVSVPKWEDVIRQNPPSTAPDVLNLQNKSLIEINQCYSYPRLRDK